MKLVQDGRMALDEPLQDSLETLFIEDELQLHNVTIRMVLNHTTGLPNWYRNNDVTAPLKVHFEPGTRFSYSSVAFVFLQKVIERTIKKAFDEFIWQDVLKPLGMFDSSFIWQEKYEESAANPHNTHGEPSDFRRKHEALANSSLYTSSCDYAKFLLELLFPTIVDETLITQMMTPEIELTEHLSWGIGWGLEHHCDGDYAWHWGDNGEYKAFTCLSRKGRDGIVILTNGANGLNVCEQVTTKLLQSEHRVFKDFILTEYWKRFMI
jgi:CubicO group peptidase (beta-lactamase class C family)